MEEFNTEVESILRILQEAIEIHEVLLDNIGEIDSQTYGKGDHNLNFGSPSFVLGY